MKTKIQSPPRQDLRPGKTPAILYRNMRWYAVLAMAVVLLAALNGERTGAQGAVSPLFLPIIAKQEFTGRWYDTADSTVTDRTSGLVWLKQDDCFGQQNWHDVMAVASATPGPFANLQPNRFWTATGGGYHADYAYFVDLSSGHVYAAAKATAYQVWPVRNGP